MPKPGVCPFADSGWDWEARLRVNPEQTPAFMPGSLGFDRTPTPVLL